MEQQLSNINGEVIMTSEAIRAILNARNGNDSVNSDTIKEKIASGEITDVRFGCGDDLNAVYATFETYEEALEAHNEDVKNGIEANISTGEMDAEEAQRDAENFHWICLINADDKEAYRKDDQVCMIC